MFFNYDSVREGFKKKGKKRDGFIQRSSDPSQPGIGMDKKKFKILLIIWTNFHLEQNIAFPQINFFPKHSFEQFPFWEGLRIC